jgi:hypothetical protein
LQRRWGAEIFDADKRLEALSARGDPLECIDRLVPWESFRAEIEAMVLTPDEFKKSRHWAAGGPADRGVEPVTGYTKLRKH